MEMKTVKLKDLCLISSSKRIFRTEYVPTGIPFYRSKEIIQRANGEILSEPLFISEERYNEIRNKYGVPKAGDILMTAVGTVGKVWIVDDTTFYFKDGNLALLSNFDIKQINPRYLYYKFLTSKCRNELINLSLGAAQSALTLDKLREFTIDIPNIYIQKEIASILSAYDDMIDNCKKQIALLEEAAQRLYREWFVDLRFPGHETTPIGENGLPEGWEYGTISALGIFTRGRNMLTKDAHGGNVPVIAGGLTPSCFHDVPNTSSPVITVSGSGANAGFTAFFTSPVWASDCSFVDSNSSKDLFYIYCFLKSNPNILLSKQKGSAQPHVYARDVNETQIIIPDQYKREAFSNIISKYFDKIGVLKNTLVHLLNARDMLLPRLISGQIEINA